MKHTDVNVDVGSNDHFDVSLRLDSTTFQCYALDTCSLHFILLRTLMFIQIGHLKTVC